jgi:hypothetical protein
MSGEVDSLEVDVKRGRRGGLAIKGIHEGGHGRSGVDETAKIRVVDTLVLGGYR